MKDEKHTVYSITEILDPSRITRLSFPCKPTYLEFEEIRRLFLNMDMRTCDGKTVGAYLKELEKVAHTPSKDCDDAMASVFIIDSLGPMVGGCDEQATEERL